MGLDSYYHGMYDAKLREVPDSAQIHQTWRHHLKDDISLQYGTYRSNVLYSRGPCNVSLRPSSSESPKTSFITFSRRLRDVTVLSGTGAAGE